MTDANGHSERSPVATTGPRLARVRRAALPTGTTAEGLPARRQWARVAAGAALALLGGWIFAALYLDAGNREEVLIVARDIARNQVIDADDLQTARVAADPEVETIGAGDLDSIVGRAARTDLRPGVLLAQSQLYEEGELRIGADSRAVGIELERGDAPQTALAAGAAVDVVVQRADTAQAAANAESDPAGTEQSGVTTISGVVYHVGEQDENTGNRVVEVVVPEGQAAEVAAAAADDRVALTAGG